MYEALGRTNKQLYRGRSLDQLRRRVEADLASHTFPPAYRDYWTNSRRLTYLVEQGFITPYSGPSWFMALKPTEAPGESPFTPPTEVRRWLQYVLANGDLSQQGHVHVTHWPDRQQVRLVFRADDQALAEIFVAQDSLRDLWLALGQMLGVQEEKQEKLLPPAPKTPRPPMAIPPEKHAPSSTFDILRAISTLDLKFDEDGRESA